MQIRSRLDDGPVRACAGGCFASSGFRIFHSITLCRLFQSDSDDIWFVCIYWNLLEMCANFMYSTSRSAYIKFKPPMRHRVKSENLLAASKPRVKNPLEIRVTSFKRSPKTSSTASSTSLSQHRRFHRAIVARCGRKHVLENPRKPALSQRRRFDTSSPRPNELETGSV